MYKAKPVPVNWQSLCTKLVQQKL